MSNAEPAGSVPAGSVSGQFRRTPTYRPPPGMPDPGPSQRRRHVVFATNRPRRNNLFAVCRKGFLFSCDFTPVAALTPLLRGITPTLAPHPVCDDPTPSHFAPTGSLDEFRSGLRARLGFGQIAPAPSPAAPGSVTQSPPPAVAPATTASTPHLSTRQHL